VWRVLLLSTAMKEPTTAQIMGLTLGVSSFVTINPDIIIKTKGSFFIYEDV
jgi:hypothetical protein